MSAAGGQVQIKPTAKGVTVREENLHLGLRRQGVKLRTTVSLIFLSKTSTEGFGR